MCPGGPGSGSRGTRCVLASCNLYINKPCVHLHTSVTAEPRSAHSHQHTTEPVLPQNWDPPITAPLWSTRGPKNSDILPHTEPRGLAPLGRGYLLSSGVGPPVILCANWPRRPLGRLAVPGLTWCGGLVYLWRPAWRHRTSQWSPSVAFMRVRTIWK